MRKPALLPLLFVAIHAAGQQFPALRNPGLVREFYATRAGELFWFDRPGSDSIRKAFWRFIGNSRQFGLDSSRYHYSFIREMALKDGDPADSLAARSYDSLFTDAVFSFCKDLHEGSDAFDHPRNDEFASVAASTDRLLLTELPGITTASRLVGLVDSLEPRSAGYLACRQVLRLELDSGRNEKTLNILRSSLDYYRWIAQFGFREYIVV